MNKFVLAFVSAMALSFTANAVVVGYASNDEWFNGGIKDGWPTTAENGGWSNTNGTTYANNKLTVSAADAAPLTFTADVAKVTAEYKATISSTVGFTAFDKLPTVPDEAKAGVIVFSGKYYAIAKEGGVNTWKDTDISVADAEVKIDVTFLDSTNVVYTIGGKSVTNEIVEATSISKVCTAGDGTLADLSATAEAKVKPVVPGQEIIVPAGQAEAKAAEINADPTVKAKYLKWPIEGQETTTDYRGFFNAVATSGSTVEFELNALGTNTVVVATTDAETNVLEVALSESSTFTVTEPIKGFYYSLKQGADVKKLDFNDPGDQDKLAGRDVISFILIKNEGESFYQTLITPTPTKGANELSGGQKQR